MWNKLINANNWLATRTTLAMGTMWCTYVFLLWSLLPLVNDSLQNLVFYVSGGVIQLIALPLIMVGQNVLSQNSEARAEQDHITLLAQFEHLKSMHSSSLLGMGQVRKLIQTVEELKDQLDDANHRLAVVIKRDMLG